MEWFEKDWKRKRGLLEVNDMECQFEEVLDRYLNKDFTSPADTEMQNGVIEIVERMHDKVVKFRGSDSRYASIINDLTFSLGLWLDGYEMDEEDPEKLRSMLCTACGMIGKPRTMEELVVLLGIDIDENNIQTP